MMMNNGGTGVGSVFHFHIPHPFYAAAAKDLEICPSRVDE